MSKDEETGDNAISQDSSLLEHPAYQELQQKLTEAEQKIEQYWDRVLRMQAEKDNLERRVERDISNAHKYALEKFATDLLPIMDSLELCLNTATSEQNESMRAFLDGVELTLKMFRSTLEKFGMAQVNPVGETFEPEFQQAISMQADAKLPPNTFISVLQKGYTLNGRLLRPALVTVSKAE